MELDRGIMHRHGMTKVYISMTQSTHNESGFISTYIHGIAIAFRLGRNVTSLGLEEHGTGPNSFCVLIKILL